MTKISKSLHIFLLLALVLSTVYTGSIKANAKTSYLEGTLLKADNSSAVYYIGPDGRKYVFPEGKTFYTWYDNFDQVKKVSISDLDQYPDGGVMPIKGGSKLITHENTANVYAVENGGVLRRVPNEAKAKELFGDDWASRVVDVLPGFFATTYKQGSELSDTLPNGYLISNNNQYYYIENGKKRLMSKEALRLNNLKEENALRIKNIAKYGDDDSIDTKKKSLVNFVPPLDDVDGEKVTICKNPPGNSGNGHTIRISKNALQVHLKNGSTLGACKNDDDDIDVEPSEPEEIEPQVWCSVLLGIFDSEILGYSSTNPHMILDLNDDGVVNLSDNAIVVDLYNDGQNQTCLDYIKGTYIAENYQDIDWCNGLVQGISDNLGDTTPFDPFDLNNDSTINLSDVGIISNYIYEGDQTQCYSQYLPHLPAMSTVVDNDVDNDGYDSVASGGTDCNDSDSNIHPGATDICGDSIDQDCSGQDLMCPADNDADNDGYDSVASGGTDCNDSDSNIHPGATELADDGIDQNCDGEDLVNNPVSGEPNIISLSASSLTHEQVYTINGEDFGNLDSLSPALWDTVDNQSLYQNLNNGDDIPVSADGFWIRSSSPYSDPVNYYTNNLRNQRSTAQYHVDLKGSLGSKDLGGNEVSKFYATWWINPSHSIYRGPEGKLASTKIIRVWENGNGYDGRLSWTGNQLTGGFGSVNSWGDWKGVSGQWNRVEIYIDSANKTVKTYTNGQLIHDVSTLEVVDHSLNRIWVLGLDPSIPENLDPNLTVDFDDIYVDTTPARVEICTGNSWENRGTCEVQPRSNWSDSQISFTANQGSFGIGQNLYLYVIDENVNISNPYPVSF